MLIAYTRSSNIFDDSRATKEISAFLEKGFQVAVYGWNRDGEAFSRSTELFKNYEGNVSFFFYNGGIGNGIIEKILARFKWNRWLKRELFGNKKIDVIHACDYDTGAAVRKVSKRKGIRYIYDIFDYYIDAHPVPGLIRNKVENEEIKVINDSLTTIICTEERMEQIKGARQNNVVVIHNSPDVPIVQKREIKYDYAYCGSLFGGRLIEEILDKYIQNNSLRFVFAGNGIYSEKARHLANTEKCFSYLGAITYDEVLKVEAEAHVLAAIYDPSKRNHRLCAPNKFYEALALEKPVIACRGTGIDRVIEENNIGVVIDYDADQFYSAVEYLRQNNNICQEMGARARKLYEENYTWDRMKQKLLGIYDLVVQDNH